MMRNTLKFAQLSLRSLMTPNNKKINISQLNFRDSRRLLNIPKIFINDNKFRELECNVASKWTKLNVLETSHGIYIKPIKQLYDADFEWIFGFGNCRDGYLRESTLYYPNYK